MDPVSDIHFGGENKEAVEAAVAWIAEAKPDLVVAAGDLTLDGKVPEFDAAAAWLARLPDPMIVAPGNHDTPFVGPPSCSSASRGLAAVLDRFGTEDGAAWRAPGIVGQLAQQRPRRPDPLELVEGRGVAKPDPPRRPRAGHAPAGDLRVVVCHHPLMEILGGPMTAKVHGGVDAANHFVQAGADVILSGHIHLPFVTAIPFGDGKTQAIGSGTLSHRERGAAPGFNVIDVEGVRAGARRWPTSAVSSASGAPGPATAVLANENGATEGRAVRYFVSTCATARRDRLGRGG
jgi:3',5'-cyclic AMP phosphodiesterase CpdA